MNKLDDETIFKIFKRAIEENKCPNSYCKEYNVARGYIYGRFKKIGVPRSYEQRQKVGQDLIDKIVVQNSYAESKELIEQCREILGEKKEN